MCSEGAGKWAGETRRIAGGWRSGPSGCAAVQLTGDGLSCRSFAVVAVKHRNPRRKCVETTGQLAAVIALEPRRGASLLERTRGKGFASSVNCCTGGNVLYLRT